MICQYREMVSIPIKAKNPGKATFHVILKRFHLFAQVICVAGKYGDASHIEIPVYAPATTEAFSLYGELHAEEEVLVQPIQFPPDAIPGVGGLEVSCDLWTK